MTQFILYRSSAFRHLTGQSWVEVMRGDYAACEARGAELIAKGFDISIPAANAQAAA